MEKFAVIDTETNWNDEVMSIGVVIANSETFEACELQYFIITPEYRVGGMYSGTLRLKWGFDCKTIECGRKYAIEQIIGCLQRNNVTKIFAYNASFDYRHLPELNSYLWYDIMRLAAYRQYNHKIKEEDCCSTGRLKTNYGVESIKALLTGIEGEMHNALCDALDELSCIMKPLGHKIENYIPYSPNKAVNKKRIGNKYNRQLKLTCQNNNEILQPTSNDLFQALSQLNKNNYLILERTPALNYITFVKLSLHENNKICISWQFKDVEKDMIFNCRKVITVSEAWKFIIDFKNDKMPDISGFEIY